MENSRIINWVFILAICLFILSACRFSCRENQVEKIEEEHNNLSQEHGELAIGLLETLVSNWEDKEADLLGVRVIDYVEDEEIKIIGCTEEQFDLHYPNNEIVSVETEARRIYVFREIDGEWELSALFTIDYENIDQTYHEWWYFPEEQKEIIGELPDFIYWECLFFVESSNGL